MKLVKWKDEWRSVVNLRSILIRVVFCGRKVKKIPGFGKVKEWFMIDV